MKNTIVMMAKDSKETNKQIMDILDTLSEEDREKKRGSYYGSLSGLARHICGGDIFFLGMFKPYFPDKIKSLSPDKKFMDHTQPLVKADWQKLKEIFEEAGQAVIDFVSSLDDRDLYVPIKLNWYGGNPDAVPLHFLLNQMIAHGIHHRGQVSQILDECGIDNDYSGIDIALMPKGTL